MELNVLTPGEALYWANQSIISAGHESEARGRKMTEVNNFTVHIRHPHMLQTLALEGRNFRRAIGVVEALQLVGQTAAPEAVLGVTRQMEPYMNDGLFLGAYGQRVYGQLAGVERLLESDPGTRQAVISIYDAKVDLDRPSKDVPCTIGAQFWIRNDRLCARFSMRSNDAWLGLPYDLFQFIALQTALADALVVGVGTYTHTVGSMHLYAEDLPKASGLKGPAQPETHETLYVPKWSLQPGAGGIAGISARARLILGGFKFNFATDFEQMLAAEMAPALEGLR